MFLRKKTTKYGGKDIFKKQYHQMSILWEICHLDRIWKKVSSRINPTNFFEENINFGYFEKLYFFGRVLWQIANYLIIIAF